MKWLNRKLKSRRGWSHATNGPGAGPVDLGLARTALAGIEGVLRNHKGEVMYGF